MKYLSEEKNITWIFKKYKYFSDKSIYFKNYFLKI